MTAMRPFATPISVGSSDAPPARRALRMIRSTRRSFGLDVGALDDRPPFLDLGLVEGGEPVGALLLRRRDLLPQIGEPLAHGRISQRILGGGAELGDRLRGRAFRHPEA